MSAVHFPTDICSVIREGVITVEKCAHRGPSARQEHDKLSLGRNKHGHNNSAPLCKNKILLLNNWGPIFITNSFMLVVMTLDILTPPRTVHTKKFLCCIRMYCMPIIRKILGDFGASSK